MTETVTTDSWNKENMIWYKLFVWTILALTSASHNYIRKEWNIKERHMYNLHKETKLDTQKSKKALFAESPVCFYPITLMKQVHQVEMRI